MTSPILTGLEEARPMESAPKDVPILIWHDHESDPYHLGDGKLTTFGSHFEGWRKRLEAGWYVAEFGGEYESDESGEGWGPFSYLPPWWYLKGMNFEDYPLAPVCWVPVPPAIAISEAEAREAVR